MGRKEEEQSGVLFNPPKARGNIFISLLRTAQESVVRRGGDRKRGNKEPQAAARRAESACERGATARSEGSGRLRDR
jgi:hypothetical protein